MKRIMKFFRDMDAAGRGCFLMVVFFISIVIAGFVEKWLQNR